MNAASLRMNIVLSGSCLVFPHRKIGTKMEHVNMQKNFKKTALKTPNQHQQ
jgi:hypothetical protein